MDLNTITVIGEVKTKSPFGYESEKSWEEQFEFCNKHADWISVHTDERWGGSFELLYEAKRRANKPILAKGIHFFDYEIEKALDIADYCLVVNRRPSTKFDHSRLLIENTVPYESINKDYDPKFVWNQRDIHSGEKGTPIENVRNMISWDSWWVCQASGVETKNDVYKDVDAVLVGTHFESFIKSTEDKHGNH